MSLNLGNHGVEACKQLRLDTHFTTLRAAIGEQVVALTDRCLDAGTESRIDATAYARGVRDLWLAIESAAQQMPQRAVERPKRKAPDGTELTL